MGADPDQDADLPQCAERAGAGIEFGIADQPDALDRLARQVARQDDLDLALHRFRIELLASDLRLARPREIAVAALQQQLRLAGIARRNDVDRDEGQPESGQRRPDDPELPRLDRGPEGRQVEQVGAALAGGRNGVVASGHEASIHAELSCPLESTQPHLSALRLVPG